MRRYSEAVKADIRNRMSPPALQSVARLSEGTGIQIATLYAWLKSLLKNPACAKMGQLPI